MMTQIVVGDGRSDRPNRIGCSFSDPPVGNRLIPEPDAITSNPREEL